MDQQPQKPVTISLEDLSSQAISGIIDEFVQREGTDYGRDEISYETKVQQVRRQLEKGEAVIVFDPNTESVQILTRHELKKQKIQLES